MLEGACSRGYWELTDNCHSMTEHSHVEPAGQVHA